MRRCSLLDCSVCRCAFLQSLGSLWILLHSPAFLCIALHCSALSWIALWVPGRTCITRRTDRTKRFKKNGGGKKELARLRILLVSKTDNPHVSSRTPSNDERRAEWWKLILLTRPRDAFPHFLASRAEIEALLRAGHTMHRVWEAYRQASPPFPATYETFRTYCVKHPPCRSYTPCIFLEISGMNLCGAAVSWIVLFVAVRSCNLLDRSGFFCIPLHSPASLCIALHCLGSLCGFLDELASLDELIAPSGSRKTGRQKRVGSFENTFGLQNR